LKKALFIIFALLCLTLTACGKGILNLESSDDSGPVSQTESKDSQSHVHEYAIEVVEATCTRGGYTLYKCDCGDSYQDNLTPPLEHDYKESEVIPADCTKEGSVTYVCSRCGDSYTRTIEKTKHDYVNAKYTLTKEGLSYVLEHSGTCRICGETSREVKADFNFGLDTTCADVREFNILQKGGKMEVSLNGDSLTFKATPDKYFRFKCWSDGEDSPSRTLPVNDAKDINAVFEYEYYTMPVMNIDTSGQEVVSRDFYVNCNVTLTNCDEDYLLDNKLAGIRVRGNSSANNGDVDWIRQNKVHYKLKFDKRTSFLGLNNNAKCKSWVMLRGDSYFVKEPLAFLMGNRFLEGEYFTSDYTFVEVYFNYEYMGVYIICDQIQVDKYRIDIDEQEEGETELETGYLLEIDNYYYFEPYYFSMVYDSVQLTDMYGATHTANGVGYSVKNDYLTDEQLKFIRNYTRNVYRIVYKAIWEGEYYKFDENYNLIPAPEFTNSRQVVENVMDIKSLVGMYLVNEVAAQRDVGEGSFYMYVDFTQEKPLLTFCAPWDYNWAYFDGTGFLYNIFTVAAWQPQSFIDYAGNRSSTWFITLYHADWFEQLVKEQWTKAVDNGWINELFEEIDRVADTYENEFRKNTSRWNSGSQRSYGGAVKSWLKKRVDWLNTQWYLNQ
jgi:hypothetical protein